MIKSVIKHFIGVSLVLSGFFAVIAHGQEIMVKGLFKNGAFVVIDGHEQILKVGKKGADGITLISADSKSAVIEVNGERNTYTVNKMIGAQYTAPKNKIVRIPAGHGNHYEVAGMINGQRALFLVDTGATFIALSETHAKMLGLDYALGKQISMTTASGVAPGYLIKLAQVSVGSITLNNVDAVVSPGDFPHKILLGNSFLKHLQYKVENNVLVLESQL